MSGLGSESPMNLTDVLAELKKDIGRTDQGTAKRWAQFNNVSAAYVCDVLAGRRDPGEKILDALGIERITLYRRKPSPSVKRKARHHGNKTKE